MYLGLNCWCCAAEVDVTKIVLQLQSMNRPNAEIKLPWAMTVLLIYIIFTWSFHTKGTWVPCIIIGRGVFLWRSFSCLHPVSRSVISQDRLEWTASGDPKCLVLRMIIHAYTWGYGSVHTQNTLYSTSRIGLLLPMCRVTYIDYTIYVRSVPDVGCCREVDY